MSITSSKEKKKIIALEIMKRACNEFEAKVPRSLNDSRALIFYVRIRNSGSQSFKLQVFGRSNEHAAVTLLSIKVPAIDDNITFLVIQYKLHLDIFHFLK